MIEAIIAVEAIRTAQGRFGRKPIDGAQGQWGLEHPSSTSPA